MAEDFGDFSSAFPNNETGEGLEVNTNDVVFEIVGSHTPTCDREEGAPHVHVPQSDLNWEFEDFPTPSADRIVPEIPLLPDDLQLGLGREGALVPVLSIAHATSGQYASTQTVSTASSCAAPVIKESMDFGDFEFSCELPYNSGKVSQASITCLIGQDASACKSSVALHSFSATTTESAGQVMFQQLPGGQQDDFSSFSSATYDGHEFGGFKTATAAPTCSSNLYDAVVSVKDKLAVGTGTVRGSNNSTLMSPANIITMCFTSSIGSDVTVIDKSIPDNGAVLNFSLWSSLEKSIDFTVPLYKWDASHLQASYYTSIKVDPMLITKVDVTSVAAVLPIFEGQSAVVDLLESFGFEGGFEPPTDSGNSFLSTTVSRFQQGDNNGPPLLDLSLPSSPSEELQGDSFTLDADLQDLDLHSTTGKRQTTSIEQLLLNEQLVINRTTWVDSELEQLGDAGLMPNPQPQYPRTDWCREKASFQEQLELLGLDTTKTSLASTLPAQSEMSISARLVFDRLPNVSFMLRDTLVVVDNQSY